MSDLQLHRSADIAEDAAIVMIDDLRADAAALDREGRHVDADEQRRRADAMEKAVALLRQRRSASEVQRKYVKLLALANKYQAASERLNKKRPTQMDVAEEFGWESEQPMRDYLRDLGIARWHDVHALVAAARG